MKPSILSCLLAASGCQSVEYRVHADERVDLFTQSRQRAVDLLLVIDNSCSMAGEQDHLARSFDALIDALGAGDTDWRVASTTSEPALPQFRARLSGGTDELVIRAANGGYLDRVAYDDTTWDVAPGVALERCDAMLAGDDPLAWRSVVGGEGTPGADNPCEAAAPTGDDLGPRLPVHRGDLVVSEFLPWPAGDSRCEWVELANPTSDTLDLTGVRLEDEGRDTALVPSGTQMIPGGKLVVGRTSDPGCAVAVDVVLDGTFNLAQSERWIEADTRDGAEVFSELVAVGTGGFGLEMGMENALLALSHPANREENGGFLRDDADLALLFFSDEDDLSPDSVDDYIEAFRSLKGDAGHRDPARVRFGAAVGLDDTCAEAVAAERYLALVARTGGTAWSICGDLGAVADEAGVTFSEQLLAFELSALPNLDTLRVDEYATEDEASWLGEMIRDVDFALFQPPGVTDAVRLVFPEDRVAPGAFVTATYDALPASATFDLGSAP